MNLLKSIIKGIKLEKILNLTQHRATKEQKDAGLIEPMEAAKAEIKTLLTFNEISDCSQIKMKSRARLLTLIAREYRKYGIAKILIEGESFFMPVLARALKEEFLIPVYAFSKRIVTVENGKEVSYFKHKGFVESADM
jgi:hypothetical protein